MKSRLFLACACCLILWGCPYTATVSLSPDKKASPDFLVGKWETPDEEGNFITVAAADGNVIDILKFSASDGTETLYHGYLTDIDGTLFLNVWDDGGEGSYYLHKIEKGGNSKLTLFEVTENIRETFENDADLYRFVKSNMQNSYFYNTGEVTYYKVE